MKARIALLCFVFSLSPSLWSVEVVTVKYEGCEYILGNQIDAKKELLPKGFSRTEASYSAALDLVFLKYSKDGLSVETSPSKEIVELEFDPLRVEVLFDGIPAKISFQDLDARAKTPGSVYEIRKLGTGKIFEREYPIEIMYQIDREHEAVVRVWILYDFGDE